MYAKEEDASSDLVNGIIGRSKERAMDPPGACVTLRTDKTIDGLGPGGVLSENPETYEEKNRCHIGRMNGIRIRRMQRSDHSCR